MAASAGGPPCLNRRQSPRAIRRFSPSWNPTGNSSANARQAVELSSHRGGFTGNSRPQRCSQHHLFLRQSSRQAAQALRAPAVARFASFPIHPSKPCGARLLAPPEPKDSSALAGNTTRRASLDSRRRRASSAAVERLDVRALRIGPTIDPGVPWTFSLGNEPLALALKSGNFGAPDFFISAFNKLPN